MHIASKTPDQVARMREAGRIVAMALNAVKTAAAPGVRTQELDRIAEDVIVGLGATPAFKGYHGYPATICASINEQVVHGIPGPRRLKDGDLLSVDCGACFDGYVGDAAITVEIGEVTEEAHRLVETTRAALEAGLKVLRAGVRLGELGLAVQKVAEDAGFSVVRQYTGHGIGTEMHEDPPVPNYGNPRDVMRTPIVPEGATLCIEPMVNAGGYAVKTLRDGWTVVTKDSRPSAHWEHAVAVTDVGVTILTEP